MSSCVIVAIPEKNDPVWRVSSEKIPHLTILFLGEVDRDSDLADRIADAVSHISNTLITRFGLYANRRDTLGDDEADVLFFDKSSFYNPLIEAREYMLKDFDIYSAYLNADQYPEWTPHLTLGYPNAPAKNTEELGSYPWVRFDKIAVWFGDFDGLELLLKDEPSYVDIAAGWSEKPSLRDLVHHGVKGQKWGVRKEVSGSSDSPKKRLSTTQKTAIGVGVLAIGAATAAIILGKQGKLPISDISSKLVSNKSPKIAPSAQRTTNTGAKAAQKLSSSDAFKKLLKEMEADLADAHKEETQWMRKNVPTYNPRLDPLVPKSELLRINDNSVRR